MNLSTRTAAISILVGLSIIFLALAVWVQLYFASQTAFANRLWDLFSMTFGGTLVILKSDAQPEPTKDNPAEPERKET